MTAALSDPVDVASAEDPVLAWLTEVLGGLAGVSGNEVAVDDAVRVDRIAVLERVKAAAAAAQSAEMVRFARSQVDQQKAAGVDYRTLGRGIADQIGMATKTGPWLGARRLTVARDLRFTLPQCFDLHSRGELSEHVVSLIVTETSHLDAGLRQVVDRQLVAAGVDRLPPRAVAATTRRLAYAADPDGSVRRGRTAREQRRVTLRPLPDTMAGLHAILPVEQGVACYAALRRRVDARKAAGDPRSHAQLMADECVQLLTGQASADAVNVEVQITVPVDHLLDPGDATPAHLSGYGPLPAGLADQIIGGTRGRRTWRRLFTRPTRAGGRLVIGGDPTARRFSGWLAEVIALRDQQQCREPFCTAPIRHLDHITPHRDGGPTSYFNGRGVCEHHNYVREMPGWQIIRVSDDDHPPGTTAGHLTITRTPTGHHYLSRAPDPP